MAKLLLPGKSKLVKPNPLVLVLLCSWPLEPRIGREHQRILKPERASRVQTQAKHKVALELRSTSFVMNPSLQGVAFLLSALSTLLSFMTQIAFYLEWKFFGYALSP